MIGHLTGKHCVGAVYQSVETLARVGITQIICVSIHTKRLEKTSSCDYIASNEKLLLHSRLMLLDRERRRFSSNLFDIVPRKPIHQFNVEYHLNTAFEILVQAVMDINSPRVILVFETHYEIL